MFRPNLKKLKLLIEEAQVHVNLSLSVSFSFLFQEEKTKITVESDLCPWIQRRGIRKSS